MANFSQADKRKTVKSLRSPSLFFHVPGRWCLNGLGVFSLKTWASSTSRARSDSESFDVVLADPPYADDSWTEILDDLDARWLVAEAASSVEQHPRWDVVREKTYGTTVVTVFARQGSAS